MLCIVIYDGINLIKIKKMSQLTPLPITKLRVVFKTLIIGF